MMVTIGSILECRSLDDRYEIYVFSNSVSDKGKDKIKSLSRNNFVIKIISEELRKGFPEQRWAEHVSKSALLKFEILKYFKEIDKILYLDADILVLQDIKKIYSIELDEDYIAAVKDFRVFIEKQCIDNDLCKESYFNSGVMLLNLKKIRENHVYNDVINYRRNNINTFMDQDAFNAGFKNHIRYLSLHYNAMATNMWRYEFDIISSFYGLAEKDLFEFYNNMILIHFTSASKPWDFYDMPFSNVWETLQKKYVGIKGNRKSFLQAKAYKPHYMRRSLLFERDLMNKFCKKKDCLISVILTIYDIENNIHKTITSILNQTFINIELIIVDAISTDKSCKVCKEITKLDDRIRVIKMGYCSGEGQARNEGFDNAEGKYVTFINIGVEYITTALEALYEKAEYYDADIVSFSECIFEKSGNEKSEVFCLTEKPELVYTLPCHLYGKMYRRAFILENNIRFQNLSSCDYLFFHYISFFQAKKIVAIKENAVNCNSSNRKLFLSEGKKHILCVYSAIHKTFKELRGRFRWKKMQPYYNSGFIRDIDYELQQLDQRDKNRMIAFWQKRGFRNIGLASCCEQNFANRYGLECYIGIQASIPGTDNEYIPGKPHSISSLSATKEKGIDAVVQKLSFLAKTVRKKKVFCGVDSFKNMGKALSSLTEPGDILIDGNDNNCGQVVCGLPVCKIDELANLTVKPIVFILDDRQKEVKKKLKQLGYRYSVDFIDVKSLRNNDKESV